MNVRGRPILRTQSRFGLVAAHSCSTRHAYEEKARLRHTMNGRAEYTCGTRTYERCYLRPIPLAQHRYPSPPYVLQKNAVHFVGPPGQWGCLLLHGRPSQVLALAGVRILDKLCKGGNRTRGRRQQLTGQARPGAADTLNQETN